MEGVRVGRRRCSEGCRLATLCSQPYLAQYAWVSAGLSQLDLGSGRGTWGLQHLGTVSQRSCRGLTCPWCAELLGCRGEMLPRPKLSAIAAFQGRVVLCMHAMALVVSWATGGVEILSCPVCKGFG